MELPLSDVRVVALEQAVAAPLCTRHLADLGADVVKVEPPEGDFARRYDSVVHGESAYFVWLNRGKRSVTLDLAREATLFERLLDRADVFVHNLAPATAERRGLTRERLRARWPRLVACAISGFGADGPYRDRKSFDLLLQGEAGVISTTGTADRPAKVGISIADISGGMYALASILAALRARDRSGEGAFIDVSIFECLTEWMSVPLLYELYAGAAPARAGMRHNTIVPYGPYRLGDGSLLNLAVQNEGQWERLCRIVLRRADLLADPRYRTNELRVRGRAELEAEIERALANETRASARERLAAADVPYGELNEVRDLVAHQQLAARDRWLEADAPSGPVRGVAHPFNIEGLPRPRGRIPGAGEQTADVRKEMER
jgi:crotonobetainyl-CoA:carnitine CoA-transferase CaiB-like acyl-CoA transferase